MSFETLGLREELVQAVSDLGFENPTPIQTEAIPMLTSELTDFVGLASTGTGKTAAFGLPLLNYIDKDINSTQAIAVCPTRELCLQIESDLRNFAKHMPWLKIVSVYGGANISTQIKALRSGAHVIVATPGRLVDLIGRKKAQLEEVSIAVLDEADEMLNMGFKDELDAILEATPESRNTWLFSATMPREVARISKSYMDSPRELSVKGANQASNNVRHEFYPIREKDRYVALKRIFDFNPDIFGVVFCRTRMETQEVAEKLAKDGYNADSLHGDLSQSQRDSVMRAFRKRRIQVLVATDVAARGIDVSDITHVIHYKLPDDAEVYTHRSGRTGRAGKKGSSVAFVNAREFRKMNEIRRIVKTDFHEMKIPTGFEICEKQLYSLVNKMVNVEIHEDEIEPYLPKVYDMLESFSKEDLIKRFVSTEFNRFLAYYRDAEDLNQDIRGDRRGERNNDRRGDRKGGDRRGGRNMQRFFVNAGHLDGLNKGALLRIACEQSGLPGNSIGAIEIKPAFSFFEVDNDHAEKVMSSAKSYNFDGRGLKVEPVAKPKRNGGGGDRRGGSNGGERRGGGDRRRRPSNNRNTRR